ncbi:MAG: hypothetical protein ACFCU1_05000 [Sumerlaeia bacterium]
MSTRLVIPTNWLLPKEISNRLGDTAGRQRMMYHDGHLLLILHKVPEKDKNDRVPILFYRTPQNEWKGSAGSGISALHRFLMDYDEVLQQLDETVNAATTAREYFDVLGALTPIQRAARNLHETLQEARETIKDEKALIVQRDHAYEIRRTAELLHEEATHGLEYEVARRAEEEAEQSKAQTQAAHQLNLLAATFFPITAVASVLGANMRMGLEPIDSPIVFWLIMGGALWVGLQIRSTMQRNG